MGRGPYHPRCCQTVRRLPHLGQRLLLRGRDRMVPEWSGHLLGLSPDIVWQGDPPKSRIVSRRRGKFPRHANEWSRFLGSCKRPSGESAPEIETKSRQEGETFRQGLPKAGSTTETCQGVPSGLSGRAAVLAAEALALRFGAGCVKLLGVNGRATLATVARHRRVRGRAGHCRKVRHTACLRVLAGTGGTTGSLVPYQWRRSPCRPTIVASWRETVENHWFHWSTGWVSLCQWPSQICLRCCFCCF